MARKKIDDPEEPELEQGTIHPDFETEKNPKIEKAARRYRKLMLERKAAGEKEVEAHGELLETMIAEGVEDYCFHGLEVHVNKKSKVKVKMAGDNDEKDE